MLPLTISAQDGLISQYDYFDKKIASINLTTYYILKNGEFAYNKSYSNEYPYGAIKRLDSFEEGALSSLYICFCVSNIDSNYLCYYFDSNKWNYEVKIISGEGARNHGLLNLTPSDFFNIRIFKPHTLEEQCKISNFLELIYAKEKIINRKINILKKYKEGIEKYAYKFVENQGSSIKFSDLFDNLIEKNNHKFQQYTIGKNGIKKIDEINYDISNHKIFKKFNVIVGIGIDEIGINKDLEYGSVSPVYDVYNIRNLKYFDSIYVTLKEQLWKKRNFITRKSTRREFEVDKYELKKMMLRVVDNKDFTNVYQSITNIKKVIEILNFSFNNLKTIKSYILRHMFI